MDDRTAMIVTVVGSSLVTTALLLTVMTILIVSVNTRFDDLQATVNTRFDDLQGTGEHSDQRRAQPNRRPQ